MLALSYVTSPTGAINVRERGQRLLACGEARASVKQEPTDVINHKPQTVHG